MRLLPLSIDPEVIQKQQDQLIVVKFLRGLRLEYVGVHNQILVGNELPTLFKAYQCVSYAF